MTTTLQNFAVAGVLLLAALVGLMKVCGVRTIAVVASLFGAVATTATLTPWQEYAWWDDGSMASSGVQWTALGVDAKRFPGLWVLVLAAVGTITIGRIAILDDRRLSAVRKRTPVIAALALTAAAALTAISIGPTVNLDEPQYWRHAGSFPAFGFALTVLASTLGAAAACGVVFRLGALSSQRRGTGKSDPPSPAA